MEIVSGDGMGRVWGWRAAVTGSLMALPGAAEAAGGVSGANLSLAWAVPFVGVLLSIALLPLVAGHLWHAHYGKIAAGWAVAFLLPFALVFGLGAAWYELAHVLVLE